MSLFNLALTGVFGFVFVLGLFSQATKSMLPVSEPLLALIFGILAGPVVFHFLYLPAGVDRYVVVEELARVTLAVALMDAAIRTPHKYWPANWRPAMVLLIGGMIGMWIASSVIIYFVLHVGFWISLLIGAVITPTDPVLAGSIVTGTFAKHVVPEHIRDLVTTDSGANDGLAYPFVFLPLLVITLHADAAHIIGFWTVYVFVWEIIGSIVIGALIGALGGVLMSYMARKHQISHTAFLTLALALSLLLVGTLRLANTDGILGVFVGGMSFNFATHGQDLERQEHVQDSIQRFFTLPVFILLGMVIPWGLWMQLGWSAFVVVGLVLLLRRIPVLLVLNLALKSQLTHKYDWLFVGWFGPVGVSALFYTAFVLERVHNPVVWSVCTLIIVGSVLAFGLSATPLTILYQRLAPDATAEERREHRGKTPKQRKSPHEQDRRPGADLHASGTPDSDDHRGEDNRKARESAQRDQKFQRLQARDTSQDDSGDQRQSDESDESSRGRSAGGTQRAGRT